MPEEQPYVLPFTELGSEHVATVGGKNASLGEMIRALRAEGIAVPPGFATTARAYWDFLDANGMRERIGAELEKLRGGGGNGALPSVGRSIRSMIEGGEFPPAISEAITRAYHELGGPEGGGRGLSVAARSSATAEDLPEASFAGQLESFLNVRGDRALLDACRRCFASLFTDRAIAYREEHGFEHTKVALSVGVQRMVRADTAGAGVMFSLDTETGFPHAVVISANWGLGESVVQGAVDPDEYAVFKPLLDADGLRPIIGKRRGGKARKVVYAGRGGSGKPVRTVDTSEAERAAFVLSDDEILRLARWACAIEAHYGKPMDMEWAKDGESGELYIVQARPETVESRKEAGTLKTYRIKRKGERLLTGVSVGDGVAMGAVCRLKSAEEGDRFPEGGVLVAEMTDPDWVPVMKRAAAIVTEHGGRTSHAAIVSRELGLTAVIGAAGATERLKDGQEVTVSCAEGDEGFVYEGAAEFEVQEVSLDELPETRTQVMLNMANPGSALRWWRLPADGVGLTRIEFVIGNQIRVHPMALARFDELEDADAKRRIAELTRGYEDRTEYFVANLAHGIARIAASRWPKPVIVRTSDFKTNEYARLIGGRQLEPEEENPMLGWRGASRYHDEGYRDGFALECRAIRRVRDEIGLTNVVVMIPFCRTVEEADRVLEVMAGHGLVRGRNGLAVYVMCEIPSNVILAEEFAERFDGFSIGSNDLTQLVLGVDRDSDRLKPLFDERNPAVTRTIERVIEAAHAHQRKVGLCGQAPSDDPAFAAFLVRAGIDSVSVSPDSFLEVKRHVAAAERRRG